MEEQDVGTKPAAETPVRARKRRKQYTPEEKQALLEAFATWQGPKKDFCQKHGVHFTTLWSWAKKTTRPARPKYTPEQKRQAVETLAKSGQSVEVFGKAWGVNPRALSRWRKAYQERGPRALEGRGGRKPGKEPLAAGLREGIVAVKQQFPDFGFRKVQGFLSRFRGVKASQPAILRVMQEEHLPHGRTAEKHWRKRQAPTRFERAKPGEMWQTDITSFVLPRYSQRVYLVAFMDDYSRYVVAWKLGVKQTTDFVQEALLEGIQRFGKPEELLSDQGRQYFAWRGKSEFQKLLTKQGIRHVVSRAHHPETLGKCERFWGTVGEEFWSRVEPLELLDAQERLAHFINHYNHFRPHQGIDNAVPADRFFGAESQVRKAMEEAWAQNQLALALNQPTRQPVFLVGQFGDQAVSLHGERGKLVFQNSQGVRQELAAHDLGMSRSIPIPSEQSHERILDSKRKQHDTTGTPSREGQAPQAGRQAQDGLQDGHASLPGAGDMGVGVGGRAPRGPQDGRADLGALAGAHDPKGTGDQAEPAAAEGLAVEPTSAGRDGGGADGPTEAAAKGDPDAQQHAATGGPDGGWLSGASASGSTRSRR